MIVRRSLIGATGRNIRGRRKRRRWRQGELARRSDLRLATISKIGLGKTNARLSTVEAIAWSFRIEPAELMNRLSAKRKTLFREEEAFIREGWEQLDHGTTLVQAVAANVRSYRTRVNGDVSSIGRKCAHDRN